ncbi:hypothetical protein HPB49_004753 [Dermacentor silvarum]|uniref:Uncharacterized protein n=1 Tax=Dermacentor silvarum TaxID=543639 RepID=A0ACB8DV48_DERSI|nr:hypothetical protein HPB49_004753 [Dermacentor silvarum]
MLTIGGGGSGTPTPPLQVGDGVINDGESLFPHYCSIRDETLGECAYVSTAPKREAPRVHPGPPACSSQSKLGSTAWRGGLFANRVVARFSGAMRCFSRLEEGPLSIEATSRPEGDEEDVREGCPQNREEAAALGRRCLRKCKTDEDCISSKKKCLCDGRCGWSCVRPEIPQFRPSFSNGEQRLLQLFGRCATLSALTSAADAPSTRPARRRQWRKPDTGGTSVGSVGEDAQASAASSNSGIFAWDPEARMLSSPQATASERLRSSTTPRRFPSCIRTYTMPA